MKFKFLFLIIPILLLLTSVTAERYVDYEFREGFIDAGNPIPTSNPVTNVGVLGFVCLDPTCTILGNKIFDYNSGSNDYIQLTYPTQLQSYGYAIYSYKDYYITFEDYSTFYGPDTTPVGPYTNYLTKKQNCQALINSLIITGNTIIGNPVTIDTNIDSPTVKGPVLGAIPTELQSYYQTQIQIDLEIYDGLNNLIYTDTQTPSVDPSSTNNIIFTWIPTNYGDYRAVIKTIIPDAKCASYIEETSETLFTITNQPPVVSDIPSQTIDEGSSFTQINLDDYVNDPDNTDSEITWTYYDNSNLIVSIVNRIATITTPNENWYGSETITFRATDPGGLYNEDPATFTVNSVNDAPVANDDSYGVNEDGFLNVVAPGILENDNDIENDPLTSNLVSDITNGILNLNSDGSFDYTPNPTFNGIDSFTYIANDGNLDSNLATVTILVNSINDAPIVGDIPSQTIDEGSPFNTFDLDNYLTEVDGDNIIWGHTGETNLIVNIDVNNIVTITTPNEDWYGSETITFTATDDNTEALFDSNDATFTINAINDGPVVSDIPSQTIDEGSSFTQINLDDYVNDPDNTDSEITWTYYDNSNLIVSIVNRIATITTPNENWYGSETITFRATDPGGLYNEDPATFTVNSVNDAPNIINEGELTQTVNEDYGTWIFDLTPFESDIEDNGAELTWSVSGVDENYIHAEITDINEDILTLSTVPNVFCEEECGFTVTLTDSDGASDSEYFNIYILPINDAPVANDVSTSTNEDTEVIIALTYTDIDAGDQAETCSVTNVIAGSITQPCSCTLGTCTVGLTPSPNSITDITADYTVNDGETDSNIATITITIGGTNDIPIWTTNIADTSQDEDFGSIVHIADLSIYVTDADGDIVTFSVFDENTAEVDCDITGTQLTLNSVAEWNGVASCTIRADDGNGGTADDTFTIIVNDIEEPNNPPTITSTPITTATVNQLYTYDVDATDDDGDTLNYSLTNYPEGMTINANTGLIQWTPTSAEVFNVAILVQDTSSASDTQVYNIQVSTEPLPEPTKEYKKKHLFSTSSISLPTNTYNQGDLVNGFIQLRNIGQLKEKNIAVYASILDLGVETIITQNLKLGPHDNKWLPFELDLPYNTEEGEYLLRIEISNSHHTEVKYIPIYINNRYILNF